MAPLLSLLLLGIAGLAAAAAAAPALQLRHPEDARQMSWAQLDALFRSGGIEGGIPAGYTYGYALVNPKFPGWQVMADAYWHGKHFEVMGKDCEAGAGVIKKGCGVVTNYLSLVPRDKRTYFQEMPGLVYIGHLKDIHPPLEVLQLDDKPSIIVDYRNKGGDELRCVNAAERIYLGRGTDWSAEYPHVFAYFILQLSDTPTATELNWVGPAHSRIRDETFQALGLPGDPDPRLVQERRVRPGSRGQRGQRLRAETAELVLPAAAPAAAEGEEQDP